jgi:hypothetical protein
MAIHMHFPHANIRTYGHFSADFARRKVRVLPCILRQLYSRVCRRRHDTVEINCKRINFRANIMQILHDHSCKEVTQRGTSDMSTKSPKPCEHRLNHLPCLPSLRKCAQPVRLGMCCLLFREMWGGQLRASYQRRAKTSDRRFMPAKFTENNIRREPERCAQSVGEFAKLS